MKVIKSGSRPTKQAPASYFTGHVLQDVITEEADRARALRVAFAPGARTFWHTHPRGQTLHVLSGVGRVQLQGGPVQEILAGDTVIIAPGEKHWHGASPDHEMVHLAIQDAVDGVSATWMEAVSDADYKAAPGRD